ncbi:MAG: tetratricopeptide repeat protein [Candidatus Obscuribacterales bacterium]
MSSFFQEEDPTPPNPRSYEAFGPKPESLAEIAEKAKLDHGENSFEYASALVKLGDAHMVQGRLANPRAQECYEMALQIVQKTDNSLAETAFVLDKLATVKHSSGDTAGAATDLKSAMELWQLLEAEARFVTDTYISRRAEDLERMEKVVAFENIRPPEL